MRRRTFVASALAAAAPAAGAIGIIDTHTHFYDPARPGGVPWPAKTETLLYRRVLPEDFRKVTSGLGVTGTVVVEASPWLEDNQWILDIAQDEPLIVAFIGHLDPAAPDFTTHLRRFTRNRLFRGIRLGGGTLAKPEIRAGLAAIAEASLTLDVIGPAAMFADVMRIAGAYPKLKIIIDHLPFDRQPNLPRADNIFAKVSNVSPATTDAALDDIWAAFGPQRVIYGSNWPVSERFTPYRAALERSRAYFAARGVESQFLRDNSRIAYGW